MKSVHSPLLSSHKKLLHAFSTRLGGFSQQTFNSNNLAYHVNDKPESVDKNHLQFSKRLQFPLKQLVHMNQVHGDRIISVDSDFDTDSIPTCDALLTNKKNIPLMVMVADCIPVLIYDPKKEVIAAIHAGRAGVFSKIIPKTIDKMKRDYGSKCEDILVNLGPSIQQCCYEVGKEIVDEAKRLGYSYAIKEQEKRYFLDLLAITQQELKTIKIEETNIEVSPFCTACNTDIFFSYRAEKSNCGRFCGLIMLK